VVQVFGITGIKYIDIIRESNAAPSLKPGDKIRPGLSTIDMVTGKAEFITQKIEIALNNIISMTREENMQNLSRMIANTGELTANLNLMVKQNQDNIHTISTNLAGQSSTVFNRINLLFAGLDSTLSQLNGILSNKSLDRSFKNMESITGEFKDGLGKGKIAATLDNLNQTLASTNQAVSQFNKTLTVNKEKLNQIMDRLEMTTRNLADFTQTIKENPSLLIRKPEE
jgi:ABC-type transporter Mla subunit MlaD